jgi:hypothetical protein
MSWRALNEPSKIVYDYAVMQNISANIIYAAGKLSSKYKKQIILDWNICTCCWRIALNSKRCHLHEFSNSKEVKKSQRIKQNADFSGVITSDLLSNIYSKIKSNDIKEFLDDLPLTKKYLLSLNIDLSNNRKIIDALDEYGDEQQRFDLHDAMSKDTFKARGIFAKCEFWLQLEAKRGSWGGRRPGAGTRATTNP